MSYDLAFWDGPAPRSDSDATAAFDRLWEAAESGSADDPLTPAIEAFVTELERQWPDDAGDSPWASPPIRGHANGSFAYVCLRYSRPPSEIESIVATARSHGLVCYDPQFSQQV